MNDKGFTLVEMMVTVAIIGIVSAIAIGGYLSYKPGNVFRTAVSQIQNDLYRAKMRAVETRRQTRVVFSANGYQIEDGNRVMNSNAWGRLDAAGNHVAGTPFRIEDFSKLPEIVLRNTGGGAIVVGSEPAVRFSPRGTAGADSVQIFHPQAGSADINVSIAGRVAITWN